MENIPIIEFDKFSNSNSLTWQKVNGNLTEKYELGGFIVLWSNKGKRLFFNISHFEKRNYLIFRFSNNDFVINSEDKFQIILQNGELFNFLFLKDSYLVSEISDFGIKKVYENKAHIRTSEILKLSQYLITDWKLIFKKGNSIIGDFKQEEFPNRYVSFDGMQNNIMLLFQDFLRFTNNINGFESNDDSEESKNNPNEVCYLYLMVDKINNYYKIGISNSPEYRERTLQSEKPSIELICSKKFPRRLIAMALEKALHETYKSKNIRGEWFNLDFNEIIEIKELLK